MPNKQISTKTNGAVYKNEGVLGMLNRTKIAPRILTMDDIEKAATKAYKKIKHGVPYPKQTALIKMFGRRKARKIDTKPTTYKNNLGYVNWAAIHIKKYDMVLVNDWDKQHHGIITRFSFEEVMPLTQTTKAKKLKWGGVGATKNLIIELDIIIRNTADLIAQSYIKQLKRVVENHIQTILMLKAPPDK